jgi:hypothetical protein
VPLDFGEFDLLIQQAFDPLIELTAENYLKGAANLSYPTNYVKVFALLERPVHFYMKAQPAFQFERERYVKTAPLLQSEVQLYMKFEVKQPEPTQRYLKASVSMQDRADIYIRCAVEFVIHANYVKVRAALSKQPIIGDIGDSAPANKVGLLSRHYLSVVSVKKEV